MQDKSIFRRVEDFLTGYGGLWILVALFSIPIYTHYRVGNDFDEVCMSILSLDDGYFDPSSLQEFKATGIDIDAIIVKADRHLELMEADSPEGRAYRWWYGHSQKLVNKCTSRESKPDYSE
jgi:hypothetical protein